MASSGIIPGFNDGASVAVGAITGRHACNRGAGGYAQCTAIGQRVHGFSLMDTPSGSAVTVQQGGVAYAISGAAITDGQDLMTNAAGEVIPWVTGTGRYKCGYADGAAAGAGLSILVRHVPDTIAAP